MNLNVNKLLLARAFCSRSISCLARAASSLVKANRSVFLSTEEAAMAAEKRTSGVLYLLCLSRETLQELYEFHLQDELSTDVENTYHLFGAEPYTFSDSFHFNQPAPVREFGVLKTSLRRRKKIFNSLGEDYQVIIRKYQDDKTPFGPFSDKHGRYYKFESESTLTVLIPVGRKEELEFPMEGDLIDIQHVHDAANRKTFIVDMLGIERGNTCLLHVVDT